MDLISDMMQQGMMGGMPTNMPQAQKGLFGRAFDQEKEQYMGKEEGKLLPSTQPTTPTPQVPTKEHLGDHVGDGYYQLNNNYWNQGN